MHIINGQVRSQSQHQFNHLEQRVSVQRRLQSQPQPQPIQSSTPALSVKQSAANANSATAADSEISNDKQLSLLKALVEALTGKTIATLDLGDTSPQTQTNTQIPTTTNGRIVRTDAVQVSESESTQVAFSGQFSTAEGSTISVDLAYSLQRSYQASTVSTQVVSGSKDPLALNFDGRGVALDPRRTTFDLDGDGATESFASLASGSAYLALDRNDDGVVNNGAELFGPSTDDGYAELAKLDSDGNGFIDSADPLFRKLLLFRPGEATQTLASADVGAIYTGNAASPARLTDRDNQSLGQLRATGFYLTNRGGAGLVQEFDLSA